MNAPVIVIGGGPAGAVCAYQLARAGVAVTLLERNAAPRPKLGETCAPSLRRLLMACGLELPATSYRPLGGFASSWGSSTLEYRDFNFWNAQSGVVLDRAAVEAWLLNACAAAGAAVVTGCSIEQVEASDNGWTVRVTGTKEQELRTNVIVEATGRSSRSVVNSDVHRWYTDNLTAVVATLPTTGSDSFAMIESCESGWWYAARLPNGMQHVVLFTDADLIAAPAERVAWFARQYEATQHIRECATMNGRTLVRLSDARTGIRNILWRDRWLCIGDAAWCLDPLSGSGIERAVRDGIESATAILAALRGSIEELRTCSVARANSFRLALQMQRKVYATEARWRDRPFWARRLSASDQHQFG